MGRCRGVGRATAVKASYLVPNSFLARPRRGPASALVLVAAAVVCTGATTAPVRLPDRQALPTASGMAAYACVTVAGAAMKVGRPDINFAPRVRSVQLVPDGGGMIMRYKFGAALPVPPAGVYFSWAVYIYRNRTDADRPTRALELQVQERGAGWAPTGWTILASTYYASRAVEGNIQTDKAHDELAAYFPAGFGNLNRPFYWFASQESYRAYLPASSKSAPVNHNIYGSLTTDCPVGVRHDPNSLPYPAKLLLAK